jgi:hypothetical protein
MNSRRPSHWLDGALWAAAFASFFVPHLLASPTAIDDAMITARYSDNVVRGIGLVYNAGERVLGTTTPLWAAATAWIFLLPIGRFAQASLLGLFAAALAFAGAAIFVRAALPGSPRRRAVTLALLCLSPTVALAARMGMETGALILLTVLLWRSLASGDCDSKTWAARAAIAYAMLLLRLDSAILLGALFVGYVVVFRPRGNQWRPLAACLGVVTAGVCAWLFVCKLGYGQALPQSMIAKAGRPFFDRGPAEVTGSLWVNSGILLGLDYPWPRAATVLAPILWALAHLGGMAVVLAKYSGLSDSRRLIAITAAVYLAVYAAFFTAGGASVFPWYAHLPTFLWLAASLPVLVDSATGSYGKPYWVASQAVLAVLVIGSLVVTAATWRWQLGGPSGSLAERDLSAELRRRGCESVMLEPIGHIGFFSDCARILDLAGLVSPEIHALRRTGRDGWFFEAARTFHPRYIVLRAGEVERNLGWNVGVLFASPDEEEAWRETYVEAHGFGAAERIYAVYERRDGR